MCFICNNSCVYNVSVIVAICFFFLFINSNKLRFMPVGRRAFFCLFGIIVDGNILKVPPKKG